MPETGRLIKTKLKHKLRKDKQFGNYATLETG